MVRTRSLAAGLALVLASTTWAEAKVAVVMVNGERVYCKLVQYVGGELVVEETNGKRVSIDVRLVSEIAFSRPARRRGPDREGPARRGPPLAPAKPSEPPKGTGGKRGAADRGGSGSALFASEFETLEGLQLTTSDGARVARQTIQRIAGQARSNKEASAALKGLEERARQAEKGSSTKVKWLLLAAYAYRQADMREDARRTHLQARQLASHNPEIERMVWTFTDDIKPPGRSGK